MKLCKLLFVIAPITCLLSACENTLYEEIFPEDTQSELFSKSTSEREIPFSAKFVTKGAPDAFSEMCEFISPTDFWGLDHQIGAGKALHLGKFTTDMTFCFHVVLSPEGLPDFAGGFGDVVDGQGYFEAANGDRLFLLIPVGKVIPSQKPGYKGEFNDTYYISGGTGRFKMASGEINAKGLIRNGDNTGVDHIWKGTIILPNGLPSRD